MKKSESDIFERADEGNSSIETKKSSLELANRTRTFEAASGAVCIGSSLGLRIFPSRMFVEVSEAGCRLIEAGCERILVLSQQR